KLQVTYQTSNGKIYSQDIGVDYIVQKKGQYFPDDYTGQFLSKTYLHNQEMGNQLNELSVNLSEEMHNKTELIMSALPFKDLKPLEGELVNTTAGEFSGYRLTTTSQGDLKGKLSLQYDPKKIPEGYSDKDVRTFYFEKNQKVWKPLTLDSLDYADKKIVSHMETGGDTDYINGVIKVPESPETADFAPTMMSDIDYADPTEGVVSIAPPSPNNMGTASTQFPIKLPPGRNGMQPSLAVSYNSEAGNGWMGIGWNIDIPAITLNTQWGVPRFDGGFESEIYSLNGEDLVLYDDGKYTNPHRDRDIKRDKERVFYQRKEGNYLKIIRHGDAPDNYTWEVIDKSGNKSFYGGINGVSSNYVLKDSGNNIAHWALMLQEDPYGNKIEYQYTNTSASIQNNTGENIT